MRPTQLIRLTRLPPCIHSCALFNDFLDVCKRGDLDEIRRFHKDHIWHHPCLGYKDTDCMPYSRFMGSVYFSLRERDDQVAQWFHIKAAEIHRLY